MGSFNQFSSSSWHPSRPVMPRKIHYSTHPQKPIQYGTNTQYSVLVLIIGRPRPLRGRSRRQDLTRRVPSRYQIESTQQWNPGTCVAIPGSRGEEGRMFRTIFHYCSIAEQLVNAAGSRTTWSPSHQPASQASDLTARGTSHPGGGTVMCCRGGVRCPGGWP